MHATFHLAGDLDVTICNEAGSKSTNLMIFRGVCYKAEHAQLPYPTGRGGAEPICADRTVEVLSLNKNEARAIASALMGCAAE